MAVVVGLVILAGVGSVAVTSAGPKAPKQFYRPLGPNTAAVSHPVVAIAHNAGNDATTTRRAILRGADVVEIDVLVYNGQLYAAHHLPASSVSRLAWRVRPPASLRSAWHAARAADAIQLDLKTSSPAVIPLLLRFLEERRDETKWIVSARNLDVLERVKRAFPDVSAVLSIGSQCALATTLAEPDQLPSLDGVSVRASLLDERAVASFHEQELFVLAWTVDNPRGLDQVLRLNVDAVTTNNLAIIQYLRGTHDEPVSLKMRDRR